MFLLCYVGVMLTARAKAKARAKRASQVRQSNTRRDARFTGVRMLNTLAGEIGLPGQRVPAPTSPGDQRHFER